MPMHWIQHTMHVFCGDAVDDRILGKMCQCLECVNEKSEDDTENRVDGVDDMEDRGKEGTVEFLDDCGDDDDGDNVLQLVPILEDEEDEGVLDLLIVEENGGSILAPCGGYGQGFIGTYHYPKYGAHIHMFYSDTVDKEVLGSMLWCPGCRRCMIKSMGLEMN